MVNRIARLTMFLIVLCAIFPIRLQAELLISELCDPRLDYATDRFIEIYNADAEAADLSGWRLVAVANDADVFTWHLTGLIDSHQALVAGDATTAADFQVAFPDEAWSGSTGNWNGKAGDGAKLLDPYGVVVDYVVAVAAEFENSDYVRNGDISEPNAVYTPGEWTSTAVDVATQASPGTHDNTIPLLGPEIESVRTSPAWPTAGDQVAVLADVTDAGANITAVALKWGLAATSLSNEIEMLPVDGDTYQTVASIPPQTGGATVYYRVQADNDLPAQSTSDLKSYALAVAVSVRDIQGEQPGSPYDGMTVTTTGVVTAVYDGVYVIQDGVGAWSGLWVRGAVVPTPGDYLTVTGLVTESDGFGFLGNTMLVDAQILGGVQGSTLPEAVDVSSAEAGSEPFEGVLVRVRDAACTDADPGAGEWQVDDGSGPCIVGVLGYRATAVLGSTYDVIGPSAFGSGRYKIQPRDANDILWTADHAAPVISGIVVLSDTSLRVSFSEPVEPTSAGTAGNYGIPGLTVTGAERISGEPDQVRLSLSPLEAGDYTLTVTGVADLFGNTTAGHSASFTYISPDIPPGYYDAADGLEGVALKQALHDIIKGHVVHSYTYAWTAYYTTDVRTDNGKVWDIYSDIPGGTPPYLYTFGVDQGGVGGEEGTGYTREHTWCKSWYGGEVSPMYTDLFALYPCDTHINGTRGVYAYGETAVPQLVTLNGSRLGTSSVPGYYGTIFEPIDEFKGDLARAYLYFSTRYYGEDAGWPGGPATEGASLKPWALDLYLDWSDEDPVSRKEIDRNNAIYLIQGNRNPFVDRPEYVGLVFESSTTGMEVVTDELVAPDLFRLYQASPNPFNPSTRVSYSQADPGRVVLSVYDVSGRLVNTLVDQHMSAGRKSTEWTGTDSAGKRVASGTYFLRLKTDRGVKTQKVMLAK
jgi:endonuclease I